MTEERKWTIVGGFGMLLFWIGACAADSQNLVLPALLIFAGLGLCWASAMRLEKE